MMKTILCFVIAMMSVFTLKAQWTVSPELGVTAVKRNRIRCDEWKANVKVGASVQYDFNSLFSLKSGLHYTQRAWELPLYFFPDGEGQLNISTGDSKQHFLQLPLLAQFGWDLGKDTRLNLAAGPYVAYCLHHSYGYGTYSDFGPYAMGYGYGYGGSGSSYGGYDPFAGTRSFDWGASFAVGLEVKQLYFNAGYDMSLGKEYAKSDFKANFHTLSLTVGYKFKL